MGPRLECSQLPLLSEYLFSGKCEDEWSKLERLQLHALLVLHMGVAGAPKLEEILCLRTVDVHVDMSFEVHPDCQGKGPALFFFDCQRDWTGRPCRFGALRNKNVFACPVGAVADLLAYVSEAHGADAFGETPLIFFTPSRDGLSRDWAERALGRLFERCAGVKVPPGVAPSDLMEDLQHRVFLADEGGSEEGWQRHRGGRQVKPGGAQALADARVALAQTLRQLGCVFLQDAAFKINKYGPSWPLSSSHQVTPAFLKFASTVYRSAAAYTQGCAACGKLNEGPTPMRKCSGCHLTSYCSKECQVAHWHSEHKAHCVRLADRAGGGEDTKKSQNTKNSTQQGGAKKKKKKNSSSKK